MPEARTITTLIELVGYALSGPDRPVLAERDGSSGWNVTTSHMLAERVAAIAAGLRERGITPGDRVALMSPNCVDWIVANIAIIVAGAVSVPIYATQAHDQVAHILSDSGARLLIADAPATLDALRASGVALPPAYVFGAGDGTLGALEATGRAARANGAARPANGTAIRPDSLAVLIYTSGTTGLPKGVMLTHRNIVSNAVASYARLGTSVGPGDPVLSILPFAHIYENTNIFGCLQQGAVVYVNHSLDTLLDDLRAVRPVMVCAVPRVFERVLVSMIARAKAGGGVRARLVPWALGTGRAHARAHAPGPGLRIAYALARALVLGKIRPLLGLDRLRFFVSGSAPLHPDTAYTFAGFGVKIVEGYGLTECSPVVTVNDVGTPVIGSVGYPIADVDVRLASDGELLVRGPNVMHGYYRDAAATAEVLVDGWFHTGDIAAIDADGAIRITDRKKELFKTSGGKYIAPARVESAIARSIFINQVLVLGNGRAHPAAIVAPNWETVRAELGLGPEHDAETLRGRADVGAFIRREVMHQTRDLGSFEQIRWVGILPRDLTVADGELSPTQKIKRRVVEERYAGLIEDVFAGAGAAMWDIRSPARM